MQRDKWPFIILPILVVIVFLLILQNAYLRGRTTTLNEQYEALMSEVIKSRQAAERAENEAKIDPQPNDAEGNPVPDSPGVEGAAPRSQGGNPADNPGGGNAPRPQTERQNAPAEPAPEPEPPVTRNPEPPLYCTFPIVLKPIC